MPTARGDVAAAVRRRTDRLARRSRHAIARLPGGSRATAVARDSYNRLRFGPAAPKYAERIWIDPRACHHYLEIPGYYRSHTGRVETGPWPHHAQQPVEEHPAVRAACRRWAQGLPWEATGELERMADLLSIGNRSDGLRDEDQVHARCEELDRIFTTVRLEGRLRTRQQLDTTAFREMDGVGFHVDADGRLVKAGGGYHRFAMALILGLPLIPAQIGVVHRDAIGQLAPYRREP
jgi:hypothetical protein